VSSSSPLFTTRFFVMCAYTFTVFVSLFQLLPAAPYHVLALGGTTFAGGLFLGFLTYSSALAAPFTGQLADRLGHRRVLIIVSLVLAAFSTTYALLDNYKVLLALVFRTGCSGRDCCRRPVRTLRRSFRRPAAPRASGTGASRR